jgi:hypothetical protein
MGVVMRAFDRDLHRDVALKITRADRTGTHSVGRFIEEAQITGQLNHPNISCSTAWPMPTTTASFTAT